MGLPSYRRTTMLKLLLQIRFGVPVTMCRHWQLQQQ